MDSTIFKVSRPGRPRSMTGQATIYVKGYPLERVKSVSGIYFVLDEKLNLVKIGHSRCLSYRVGQLMRSSAGPLFIIGAACFKHDFRKAEKLLHGIFEPYRQKGEWFRPSRLMAETIFSINHQTYDWNGQFSEPMP